MKIIKEETPKTGKKEVEILLPKDEIQNLYQNSLKELSKTAHLKGFRKGKAPVSLIESMYGPQTRRETVTDLIKEKVGQYLQDYFYVKTEPVKEKEDAEGVIISFSFEYLTELEGLDEVLKGLDFSDRKIPQTQKEDFEGYAFHVAMDTAFKKEHLETVDEPARFGDYVVLKTSLKAKESGKKISESSMQFIIPHNEKQWDAYLSRLDTEKNNYAVLKEMPGKKPGDNYEVPFDLDKHLKIKRFDESWLMEVTVEKVLRLTPENKKKLFEEKEIGFDYENIDEVYSEMESTLKISAYREENRKIAEDVIEKIISHYLDKVDINEDILERKMKETEQRLLEEMSGKFYETKPVLKKDLAYPEEFESLVKETAKKELIQEVVYASLQKLYKITVHDQDINRRIQMIAMQNRLNPKDVEKYMEEKNLFPGLFQQITVEKVHGYLENEFGKEPPKAAAPSKKSTEKQSGEEQGKIEEQDSGKAENTPDGSEKSASVEEENKK